MNTHRAALAICITLGTTSCGSQAVVSTDTSSADRDLAPPATEPPAPEAAAAPTVDDGTRIHVDPSTLPTGMHLIEESPRRIGEQETLIARFARQPGLWNQDGPYLRVIAHRNPGIEAAITTQVPPDARAVLIDGAIGYYDVDESTDPQNVEGLPPALAALQNPWTTITWPLEDDLALAVQAKGITEDQLIEIAQGVTFDA